MKSLWMPLLAIVLLATIAQADAPGVPDPPLTFEAKQALLTALTGRSGEYANVALHTAVIRQHGKVEPHERILQDDLEHRATLQQILKRYGVSFPSNPFLARARSPEQLRTAARAGVELALNNIAMYDKILPDVKSYTDIYRALLAMQAQTRKEHIPLLVAASRKEDKH